MQRQTQHFQQVSSWKAGQNPWPHITKLPLQARKGTCSRVDEAEVGIPPLLCPSVDTGCWPSDSQSLIQVSWVLLGQVQCSRGMAASKDAVQHPSNAAEWCVSETWGIQKTFLLGPLMFFFPGVLWYLSSGQALSRGWHNPGV